MKNRI